MTDSPDQIQNLRNTLATQHGISDDDRDALLTSTDPERLALQAQRLAALNDASQAVGIFGNVARGEGNISGSPAANEDGRNFARSLFDNDSE